jgi:hypothetical protein
MCLLTTIKIETKPQPQQMQGYKRIERKKPWLVALIGILIVGFELFY